MIDPSLKLGLVLAGGGALGAYQVGALRCIARLGVEPTAIAGSSIGALNTAVIAASGTLGEGVERLDQVWRTLPRLLPTGRSKAEKVTVTFAELISQPILDPDLVGGLVAEYVDLDRLRSGPEAWVTAFSGTPLDLVDDLVRAMLFDAPAEYFHLQEHLDDAHALVTASAALPPVFPGRRVDGRFYRDGGLGDNVPARAIADRCDLLVVVHLRTGTAWDPRAEGITTPLLEIRPDDRAHDVGGLRGVLASLLDFSPPRLETLRTRGYEDAERALTRAALLVTGNSARAGAEQTMTDAVRRLRLRP